MDNYEFDISKYNEYRRLAEKLTDDELVSIYCDWGAMGRYMDCDPEEFAAVSDEINMRNV